MAGQIEISWEATQEFFQQLPEKVMDLWEQIQDYFTGLNLFQIIAWSAIGLGLILVIVSLIVW